MTAAYLHPALVGGRAYLAPLTAPAGTIFISTDLAGSYAIRASVSADLAGSFAIRKAVSADLLGSYAINGNALTSISSDLAGSYSIRASVSRDFTGSYGIQASQPAAQLTPAHKMYSGTNRNRFYAAGSGKNFSPKRSVEREVFTVDFADILPDGDSIASAAWSSAPVDGQDATASSMIQGDASRDGSMVSQMIVGGVPGVMYAPICTAQTVLGETLVLPEYGFGLLYISG